MVVYIDTQARTFSTVEPSLSNRVVIEQILPLVVPLDVIAGLLASIQSQSMQGADLIYKVTIA